MIESFVDLTYRGLALGRRIKLTEVRPTTAYVELPAPMPVGTQVALVTDDGLALDATVTWIHEQVAGAERPAGMVVSPVLTGEDAAAWWRARVALPDDLQPRPRPSRSRPVTVRPRTNTERTRTVTDRSPPPQAMPDEVPTVITRLPPAAPQVASELDDGPTIIADLEARVTAAAGLDLARPDVHERPTVAMPAIDVNERATVAMGALDQQRLAQATIRPTGEHDVVDDGKATMIMEAVDPATLGIDLPAGSDAPPHAISDEPSAPVITIEAAEGGDDDEPEDGEPAPSSGAPEPSADKPANSRSFKRRRKRR